MRAIRRIGKTEQKFVFSVHVCDVRGLPAGVSTVSVSWQRGDRVVNTPSVSAQGSGGERGARIDAKLTHVATLYASKDQFDPKPSSLRVLHTPAAGAKPLVIAVAELDLAEYVTSHAEGTARPRQIVKQVLLTPPRGSEHKEQVLVQLSVDSHASMLIDQTRPLAVAELGSCASSARALRLCDRSMLSGEMPAHWAPSHCLGRSSWSPPSRHSHRLWSSRQTLSAATAGSSMADGASSEAGDSEASQESAALTHEALSAYDAAHDVRGGRSTHARWCPSPKPKPNPGSNPNPSSNSRPQPRP
eukprot:scaffold21641_cov53-Phaeocystis_antarctica.AAC.2